MVLLQQAVGISIMNKIELYYVAVKLCIWLVVVEDCSCSAVDSRLLIVSFDGFRNDFFNRSLTPNFQTLLTKSSYTARMLNVFPTQTFPNHFSIATGLYAEDHGVLATEVKEVGTRTVLGYGYKLFHYNDNITPIWTLNEMANGTHHSGCMMWPGCEMAYRGVIPTYTQNLNLSISWNERVNKSISWFMNPVHPANLVMLYFESPDEEEHIYGPNSAQTNQQIKRADETVGLILRSIESNNLTDVNVIFLSDHGMEAVTLPRIINLTGIINNLGDVIGTSPVLQIYPHDGKLEELYSNLYRASRSNGNFDVYKKQDIPERYHYKNCKRAPPILVVAKPKYGFQDIYKLIKRWNLHNNLTVDNSTEFGVHGYDPDFVSMQPFLIAHGPKFEPNFQLPNRTVDLFWVFIDVLGLQGVNQLVSDVAMMHDNPLTKDEERGTTVRLVLFSLASSVGLTIFFLVFIMFHRNRSVRNMGYTLVDKDDSRI